MSGRLTTHVLDTAHGCPASGVGVRLSRLDPVPGLICTTVTNADGRCNSPLLSGDDFREGSYELSFMVAKYFAAKAAMPNPSFLDEIIVRFIVADSRQHYHVPLLVSPYGYSTYRGS